MVITFVSVLHTHNCLRMLEFEVRKALKMLVCPLGSLLLGWAFLEVIWCLVGFVGHFALGEALMWDDCLLGSLRYLACGLPEHFALQKAWGL